MWRSLTRRRRTAAAQVIGRLARHATTRVGPRGAQVAVPRERLEAVTVRHYTSRSGDPHRHLHLQVNARVFAAGKWRGLESVAFRDSIGAINGIGHAAVACDPDFRTALAAHGYSLTADGQVEQLAPFVGAFSKRAAQIATLLDRYEAGWRADHPGVEPGPKLRRTWDARRGPKTGPTKSSPRSGEELRQRWLGELAELGYRDRDKAVQLALQLTGRLDRDEVLTRLGAGRSAWNAADVRGQVEQLLARTGSSRTPQSMASSPRTSPPAYLSCACRCASSRAGACGALTSRHVLGVEADLVARLAARGSGPRSPRWPATPDSS
jgi:exodeoxyribonuclease V alpha subunit